MAESFGVDAERYDRARPGYPDELVNRIVAAAPGRGFLDVGCGTGIVSRQFQAAGCTVLGVDPDSRMAGFARRIGIDVEVATFEEWDPAGRTFDAVVAAQSWHWVDPVAGATKAAAVLRPGGVLAIFAHAYIPPPEIANAFAEVYRRVLPDAPFTRQRAATAPDIYEAMFAKFAGGIEEAGGFGTPDRWRFEWTRTYTRDAWLDFLPTTGGLTRLPKDKLDEILSAVGNAIDAHGGEFTLPHTTLALIAGTGRTA
ncbi:class I SAM-dependent methyltransferase [Amycolatopsis alkalitolerans]|uniref:Class I SAM-dependent methyltransferase n=1 Tax=Amycolatopsis alkalitolerans TaxID=2547244 RepID=A0A5C4LSM4_9PSEU|nr:class I SAM-dependent methyltransferase [Amycolatopsis alkalitolerans]TNC21431.1 class I SAM-dependent methyltransferase [Amycolatopsis alkalitolerans]